MASSNFTYLADTLARAGVNFGTDSFKVLLATAVPNATQLDTWQTRADVTTEVTGTGYTAGGVAVTATIGAVDTVNNRVPVTWGNLSPGWTGATITAAAALIYKSTGTAATDSLICAVDIGSTSSTNGNFALTFTTPTYINA